jgi:hypothetical protein
MARTSLGLFQFLKLLKLSSFDHKQNIHWDGTNFFGPVPVSEHHGAEQLRSQSEIALEWSRCSLVFDSGAAAVVSWREYFFGLRDSQRLLLDDIALRILRASI